jgi:hypothetical protein
MAEDITDPKELRQYLDRLEQSIQAVQRRLKRYEVEYGKGIDSIALENAEVAGDVEMLKRLQAQRAELKKRLQ